MGISIAYTPQTNLNAGDASTVFALLVSSEGSTVQAGNGADQFFVFSDNDVINAGNGANILLAQTTGSTITLGAGNAFVFGNNDNVTVTAPTQVVSVIGTSDSVTVGNQPSNATGPLLFFGHGNKYAIGSGNVQVYDSGSNTQVKAGAGNTTVVGTTGSANITLGNGNDLIGAAGTGNTITLGAGNSTVFAGSGNDTVTVGNGNDTFVLGGSNSTLVLGTGQTAVFLAIVGGNSITLADTSSRIDFTGFDAANGGDTVRLGNALHTSDLATLQTLITTSYSGNDTLLNTASGTTIVDFHGIGQQSLTQLIANHSVAI